MKKEFKSTFFNDYVPSSHPKHGSDARTTYIRLLMRGYIKERALIEYIKQYILDNRSKILEQEHKETLINLNKEYADIVYDMKLCFKRLLSRQEHANKERNQRKERIERLNKKVDALVEDNKNLHKRLKALSSEKSEKKTLVYSNN